MAKRELSLVAELGKPSALKRDINRGIRALGDAPKSECRPHLCLNGEDGMLVLEAIARQGGEADTEHYIWPHVDVYADRIWMNVSLIVYLDELSSKDRVTLAPQQTAYLVQNLPPASQEEFLGKLRRWYAGKFMKDMQAGLKALKEQFESGELLVDDYFNGRVFDIHSERKVEYTECKIVGEALYWNFLAAGTGFEGGDDLLEKADILIGSARARQRRATGAMIDALRSMG
jgi:hypothetical protein